MHSNHKPGQLNRPLGPGMQQTSAPGHMQPPTMVEGGQLGLGVGRSAGHLGLHGRQIDHGRTLDLHPAPWHAASPGSQVQAGLHVHQQSQHVQQQQPWLNAAPKDSQQQQQLPMSQQQQQTIPPPPSIPGPPAAGGPLSANAAAKGPRTRWDRNAATEPSQQQQLGQHPDSHQQAGQQQQQQHMAHTPLPPGGSQPPQVMLQQLQGPPAMQGVGHNHIPVLQLEQISPHGPAGSGFLQLDRLEAPPPQPTNTAAMPVRVPAPPHAAGGGGRQVPLPAPPSSATAGVQPPAAVGMQRPGLVLPPAASPALHGQVVITGPPGMQHQQPLVLLGTRAAAAGVGGAPSSVMMQPVAHLLQREAGNLQSVLKVLQSLSKQQQANRLPHLTVHEAVLASELLAAAAQMPEQQQLIQQHALEKQKPLEKHPGVQFFCQWMQQVLPQLEVQQQLQLLDCLASLAQAGLGPISRALVDAVLASLADAAALEQPEVFLSAAAALPQLAQPSNSNAAGTAAASAGGAPGLTALLSEQLLKKLMREDADVGCRLVLEVLIGLHQADVAIPQKLQDGVSKVLQDHLPRFTPPQLAALLACHSQLGLENYSKLLRKTAAEYYKRPVAAAGVELLLGVMGGVAAGGYTSVKELPVQLLAKMCDELQPLLPSCSCTQLLTACRVLAQLGCLKANSPKQQQIVTALQQQLKQRRLHAEIWLALPDTIHALQEISGQQHQAGLATLVREATAIQDSQVSAVQQAAQQQPADVLKLVAGLQLQEQLNKQLDALKEPLLLAIQQLCGAAANEPQQDAPSDATALAAGLIEQLRTSLGEFTLQELTAVVQAVVQLWPTPNPATDAAAKVIAPGAAVTLLLQAVLQTEVLLHKQVPAEVAAAAAAARVGSLHEQQQQQRAGTPPPPPTAAGAPPPPPPPPAAVAAAAPTPPPPPAAAIDQAVADAGTTAAADALAALLAPVVFVEEDWTALAQLLQACVHWYQLEDLPQQMAQLVLEVVESQAAVGSVINCTAESAVGLLWGLAVAGALMLELWDALAIALDKPGVGLKQEQLRQVFEAYCLVVLRIGGPTPRPVPAGQLAAAGKAYWDAVVSPMAAARSLLQQALVAAGLSQPRQGLTQLTDGHLMLFDVALPELQQAWLLAGSRSALTSSAAELLLARYGWTCVHVSAAQLNPEGATNPNPASCATQLQQLSQVSQLLPRLIALLDVQQQQQVSVLPDAAALAGLGKLVTHLKKSIRQGTLLAALPPAQMNTLRQIAEMYKGEVLQRVVELPPFGRARLRRLQHQAAAAASDAPESEEDAAMEYDENTMDAEDMFIHNRLWLSVEDPWWFCQRLLVQDGAGGIGSTGATGGTPKAEAAAAAANAVFAVPAGTAAAVSGQAPSGATQNSGEPMRFAREAAESQRIAREAAAAALVVRAQWAQHAAEAAAAAAAARAAAGLPPLGEVVMHDQDIGALDAAAEAAGLQDGHMQRGRSLEQLPKHRRHWRESRSRSRSCSVDSGVSSTTYDGSSSRGGSSEQVDDSSDSDSEEGAISTDSEEGEVALTPRSKAAAAAEAQQQREAELRSSRDKSTAVAAMPVSFAARGLISKDKRAWKQQQDQHEEQHGGRIKLRRGRSNRSNSRGVSRSRSRDRDWWYGRSGRHADKSRSRSPHVLRRGRPRSRSRSESRSKSPRGRDVTGRYAGSESYLPDGQQHQQYDAGDTAVDAAATAGPLSAQQQPQTMQERMLAAAAAIAEQQQQLHREQMLAAAAAAAAAQQQQQKQARQKQQELLQQQRAEQLKQRAARAILAPWMAKFAHMPKSQEKLASMLSSKLIYATDFTDSGVAAALQLSDDTLLQILEVLTLMIHERKAKEAAVQEAAKIEKLAGIVNGPAAEKLKKQQQKLHSPDRASMVNGQLVQLCRKHGAKVQSKRNREELLLKFWDGAQAAGGSNTPGSWGGLSADATVAAAGGVAAPVVAAAAPIPAAAAANAALPQAVPAGAIGYMYMNGMLVPVAANAAAGFALGGYAGRYGAVAAAHGADSRTGKAHFGGKGRAKVGRGGEEAADGMLNAGGGNASVVAAGGGDASGGSDVAGSEASGKSGKMMSQYWQALCSGLGGDGDAFSDVEDEPIGGKGGKGKQRKQQHKVQH